MDRERHQPERRARRALLLLLLLCVAAVAGRRVRSDARRNLDTLLEAAKSVFAAGGVDAPVRDIADRFEHRLFLSATPHNGHANSFATLLEILPQQLVLSEEPKRRFFPALANPLSQ